MKRFCSHDWQPWSEVVNTANPEFVAQFRCCRLCSKVVARFIRFGIFNFKGVLASVINKALNWEVAK